MEIIIDIFSLLQLKRLRYNLQREDRGQGVAYINYVIDTDRVGCMPSVLLRKKKEIC